MTTTLAPEHAPTQTPAPATVSVKPAPLPVLTKPGK